MKSFILVAIAAASLVSCAGLPPAANPGDSLVIGSFVLDFPKGFFDMSRMSIGIGVRIDVKDVTSGERFSVVTQKGHFWFDAVGGDEYELVSYHLLKFIGGNYYYVGWRPIGVAFQTETAKVTYVGDFKYTFDLPPNSVFKAQPAAEKDYELKDLWMNGTRLDYVYGYSVSPRTWNDQALVEFLRTLSPESPWLGREIVNAGG